MKIYVIASHVYYPKGKQETFGPPHELFNFLVDKSSTVYFIKFDISGNKKTVILDSKKNLLFKVSSHNILLRYINELFTSIIFTYQLSKKNNEIIYIGIDPINGLAGTVIKFLKFCSKSIYFSVDYSEKRYANRFLNSLYFFIDNIAAHGNDQIWSVSSRIENIRLKQRIKKNKCYIVPNSPDLKTVPTFVTHTNNHLVLVANLEETVDLKPLLHTLLMLKDTKMVVELDIIGAGTAEKTFKEWVSNMNLNKNVHFLGTKKREDVLKIISRSFLGIALYVPNGGNYFGDSMKAREYLACGIPVIINNVPSTADDIRNANAGLVLDKINEKDLTEFIEKCYEDKEFYGLLRKNALLLAQKSDKRKILQKLLK